ncbi:MAG: hypothetical protein CVT49_10650 [candidate division Zixibacteria bacterium HGW-Zixibacteria-1]|nr:MAG: hypothetical protein CVT49_10650 [candidate division Zixibacteria bacterium HGW-Zixibacteria-1]
MSNIGLIISLIIIAIGLLWLFILSLRGKEVERQIIFLFIGLSVSVPLLFNITFSEKATPIVMDVFNKIENLPAGSKILLSYDYGPSMAPEVEPMSNAFLRHALAKGHRVYVMCLWATGQSLAGTAIDSVVKKDFPDKVYGVDYINIGFKAGGTGVLNVIITDFRKMYLTDVDGRDLDSLAIFNGIRSLKDMDLLISIGGGYPGVKEWILFAGSQGNIPTAGGCAAVSAPLLYPYYPKQMVGLLGGIKGAAEYESQLKKVYKRFEKSPTPGIKMMGPQTLAHLIVMAFIVIGNISYFVSKRKRS